MAGTHKQTPGALPCLATGARHRFAGHGYVGSTSEILDAKGAGRGVTDLQGLWWHAALKSGDFGRMMTVMLFKNRSHISAFD